MRGLLRELIVAPVLSQRRRLWGMGASLLFLSGANALFLLVVKVFIKALFPPAGQHAQALIPVASLLPDAAKDYVSLDGSIAYGALAVLVPVVLVGAGTCRALATYLYQLNQQALVLYVFKNYRERLFDAVLGLPYVAIRKRQTGEWMSIVMNDVMFIQTRFSDAIGGIVQGGVSVVSSLVILACIHWPSALALLVISPLAAYGMGRTGKRIARYAEAFQRELGRIAGAILDFRARFEFIRAQQGEEREAGRFAAMNLAYYRMIRRSIMVRSAFAPALEFLGFSIFAAFIYLIGHGRLAGLTPDKLLTFLAALGMMMRPLRDMGEQLSRYHETRGTLRNSLELFDSLRSSGDTRLNPNRSGSGSVGCPQNSVHLRRLRAGMGADVRFSADDLALAPGRAIAVVGPSGAGKSTLLKTLAGLVEPIEWDADRPWADVTADVSMVSQEPFLFDDSITENLAYGLPDGARPQEKDLWDALATVNIDQEVKALPRGLATEIRAIGSNVSGGQLQRLVIARGLLRKKKVWLLDEATSAIDARSEKDITLRLIDACHATQKSLLAVTHRLTWLEAFDEVWFVENGQITLRGPHAVLLNNQRYKAYCSERVAGPGEDPDSPSARTSGTLDGKL